MTKRTIFALILFTTLSISVLAQTEITATLVNPPVATRQLGPAIFFNAKVLKKFTDEEGNVFTFGVGNRQEILRAYVFFGADTTFGMYKEFAQKLGLQYGNKYSITVSKTGNEEKILPPKKIGFKVENYKGDLKKWRKIAIGAPHGDCDNETGAIVKLTAKLYGIPATAAYGCRLSYRGIWYDCNRPLMKMPKKNRHGVIPERIWNKQAEEKYHTYQDSVWANSRLKYGRRFKLFTSFHGHDLTVRLPNGKRVERPVIEGMGVGFTKNELRKIKSFYNRHKYEYYKNPPAIYFGNLPEDRYYICKGQKLSFFYSGLGTRTYGSLRSDIVEHALHLETPNTMRLNPKVQPTTAKLLHDLYVFIVDSILNKPDSVKKEIPDYVPEDLDATVEIPAGVFIMGAPDNFGWSSEHPQRIVFVDSFSISKNEVTNFQYAKFLNEVLAKGEIEIEQGKVTDSKAKGEVLCDLRNGNPFAEIYFANGKFGVKKGREYFPVVYVSYYGAEKYAKFYGMRLPTEAEWEKAASWQNGRKFLFSSATNGASKRKINFEDSNDPFEKLLPGTTPVGYLGAGVNNLNDMSGNVWEWCSDYYNYSQLKEYTSDVTKNPKGPGYKSMKTIRGGAWNTEGFTTRTTMRLGINPNARLVNVGFRCVK